jgi:tRNA(Ile)-lysidine synthase
MRTKLHRQVLDSMRRHRMISPGDRVGVAVSGGADSVALLRLLEDLRETLGITLLVLHLNHALRGEESNTDERFVAGLACQSGVEFISVREDVAGEARRHRWNLEDAARRLRYAFFERVVAQGRATRVAVAHTAHDQAETVLARLIRGTGPTGLAGIYPIMGHVVRPLLEIRRQELRDFLRGRGEAWREDSTNRDTRRMRSRIRQGLLPVLERDFSGAIAERLGGLARLARDEEVFWAALVQDRFRASVTTRPQGLSIRVPDLVYPLSFRAAGSEAGKETEAFRVVSQRLVRRIDEELRKDMCRLSAGHVEQVLRLATHGTSGQQIQLPGGLTVERDFDRLVFSRPGLKARSRGAGGTSATPYEYSVSVPKRGWATVSVPELGRRFRLKVIDWPLRASDTKSAPEALDIDLLRAPLVLRNWRPGDVYRPRGRRQARKLKELFQAGRIALRERAQWPVLTSAGNLVWARGMPPAAEFSAKEGTRAGLLIAEEGL